VERFTSIARQESAEGKVGIEQVRLVRHSLGRKAEKRIGHIAKQIHEGPNSAPRKRGIRER